MDTKRPVSSRLIKQEKKKLVRQTALFIIGAVILTVIFIFVVLPLFIRFINAVLNTNPIADDDSILLQPPVISAPAEATNTATYEISGFNTPGTQVIIVLNGSEHTRVTTKEDGSFTATLRLTEGENSMTSYTVDEKNNESRTRQHYIIILDTEDPTLEISEPQDGATVTSRDRVVTVAGKTDDGKVRILVNDRTVYPSSDGTFSTRFSLSDGSNEITVKAVDLAGNETAQVITVEYAP